MRNFLMAGLILLGSSPLYTSADFPERVYWGDTHVHTSMSADANSVGNATLTPADAYRFARGETVTASNGMNARIQRAFDFLLVADHAEYFGVAAAERRRDPVAGIAEFARQYFRGDDAGLKARLDIPAIVSAAWRESLEAAEQANQPGQFTALLGFEWTGMTQGNNLHRVVMFRDPMQKVGQVQPFAAYDSNDPPRPVGVFAPLRGKDRRQGAVHPRTMAI